MKTLGFMLVLIGTTMADSDSLILPIAMMAIGGLLMLKGGLD